MLREKRKIRLLLALTFLVTLGVAVESPAHAWGRRGHRAVHELVLRTLREDARQGDRRADAALVLLDAHPFLFIQSADLPDNARGSDDAEPPRHFLDLEEFGDPSFLRNLPATRPSGISDDAGSLPWALGAAAVEFRRAAAAGDAPRALRAALFMGHYAADVHVPLHSTTHYDGRNFGEKGIHSRWESKTVESMKDLEKLSVSRVRNLPRDIRDEKNLSRRVELATASAIELSHLLVDSVFERDREARAKAGWERGGPKNWPFPADTAATVYLAEMRKMQGKLIESRLAESARFIVDLIEASIPDTRVIPPPEIDEVRMDKAGIFRKGEKVTVNLRLTRLTTAGKPKQAYSIGIFNEAGDTLALLAADPPILKGESYLFELSIAPERLEKVKKIEFRLMPPDSITPEDNIVTLERRDWE